MTGPKKKHPGAVAMAKLRMALLTPEERQALASKAGKSRAKKIPAKRRKEIARQAAEARWRRGGRQGRT